MYTDLTRHQDYRSVLRTEFELRQARNPAYSLRAFARDLKTSPSTISAVLSGQHGISRAKAKSMAAALEMPEDRQNFFCDLVDLEEAVSLERRQAAAARVESFRKTAAFSPMRQDVFRLIADWYHAAILEMLYLPEFSPDPQWVAGRLGISVSAAADALERLRRLDILEIVDGRAVSKYGDFQCGGDVPSQAIRTYHSQVLGKALQALEAQAPREREFQSAVIAIREDDVPHVKARMQGFLRELCQELSGSPGKDRIYSLSMQFFAIDVRP